MTFPSVLFPGAAAELPATELPAYFTDLNLDQVVSAAVAGKGEYDLAGLFAYRLTDPDLVRYRHAVVRDLESPVLRAALVRFADGMAEMRQRLGKARAHRDPTQRQSWLLDAAECYCATLRRLSRDPALTEVSSDGLQAIRDYLIGYVGSHAFCALEQETTSIKSALGAISYTLDIKGTRITVGRYEGEPDYGAEVAASFERFTTAAAGSHLVSFPTAGEVDHVEAQILEILTRVFSDEFGRLADFSTRHADFVDGALARFDREIQFYVGYLDLVGRVTARGLPFCLPDLTDAGTEVVAHDSYDLALAVKQRSEQVPVVVNDISLTGEERVLVVTGPNQGGKTTYARAFGQLHHLAALGLPVPGRDVRVSLGDQLFTHFERVEKVTDLRSKLEDELVRMREILDHATARSVVVVNEIFTATTLEDADNLSRRVVAELVGRGVCCVWVTFVDALSRLGPSVVSMVADVDPGPPLRRTFRVSRRAADGRAYAVTLARSHRLTYDQLTERIDSSEIAP